MSMRRIAGALALLIGVIAAPGLAGAEDLPQRWVSAGGSLSEWIVALGGERKLVGVDSTSQHPDGLRALPSIGYQRQLAAEGILALKPDLLLGSEEMGPPTVLAQLKAAGVRIETLSAAPEVPALQANLKRLGDLLGDPQRAARTLADYEARLQRQAQWVEQARITAPAPRVLFLLGHVGNSPMAAGKDTAAAWFVEHAGGRNLTGHDGYKPISAESMAALDPDVVVFADRRLSGDEAIAALLKSTPALASTKAAKGGRILWVDPTLLVGGLGPRIPQALADLSAGFYPAAPPLKVADRQP
ncbi:heme/hemin ABC transporter substrate-binding protein [Pseudomonas kuykendallii]|uniref:Hemin ABC transporter substrate-binding protein n=1 Tax=Pseudomonas kuykendallii TaxID=1007099 RepID=A0A2W5EVX2_9PSED|nr:ABC transporter substrate-binding protein [Pseudomonas kuykendallii]PZP21509.1 MAG: hemin ABC transporter substrate-binding protein [Pseudomonas kuykendallii]